MACRCEQQTWGGSDASPEVVILMLAGHSRRLLMTSLIVVVSEAALAALPVISMLDRQWSAACLSMARLAVCLCLGMKLENKGLDEQCSSASVPPTRSA